MLRTRILSASTAALLAAGLILAGTGTAFADELADTTVVDEQTTSTLADEARDVVGVDAETECVVVVWQMPSWVSHWDPTWPQSFVSVHDADCSTTPIDAALFPVPDTCDTQYQLDKYYASEKTDALIAGGVLLGYGPEEDLVPGMWGTLVHNPACEPPTLPVLGVVASAMEMGCGSAGWFAFGPGPSVSAVDAERLDWTVTPDAYATNTTTGVQHPVSEPVTIVITVSKTDAAVGLSDESGTGVVNPATGAITYTFEFVDVEGCELGTLPTTTASASFVMPSCLGTLGQVVLTNQAGVVWTLDGSVVAGNSTHVVAPGTSVALTAGLEGASPEFPGGFGWNDPQQRTQWNETFAAAGDDCLPTLALTGTGAATGWLGAVAALLVAAGIGLVARRSAVAR